MSDKTPPPLLGFNNNVKHRGRIFHIQTEDSGVKRPHVITHLFADGGRIVKSCKTNYAEHVGRPDTPQMVRKLMKEQHKGMFIALRAGEFDEQIIEICGDLPEAPKKAALRATATALTAPNPSQVNLQAVDPKAAAAATAAVIGEKDGAPGEDAAAVAKPERERRISNPNLKRASVPPPSNEEIDFDSIERAAREAASRHSIPDVEPPSEVDAAPPPEEEPGRYAASRPAAIFQGKSEPPPSIFGEGVISEKSLDEVILSYLAEDLESTNSD